MRVIRPDVRGPFITTAFIKEDETWFAAIYNDDNEVIFCTTDPAENFKDDIYNWDRQNYTSAVYPDGGVEYI